MLAKRSIILANKGKDISLKTSNQGIKLQPHPPLRLNGQRFGVFEDPRFYNPHKYKGLEEFLPSGYELIAGPMQGQNCFGYCMGERKIVSASDFNRWLRGGGREKINDGLMIGDLVVYYPSVFSEEPSFAAIADNSTKVIGRIGCCNGFGGVLIRANVENMPKEFYDFKRGSLYQKWRRKP